ncbi:YciI-like protein [Deinococcus aquaedulcis]|uniref:YciI-like protein n=1 Tax=Deinococcus aquaedulcis TaxID=2840455 RepID=UPI001C83F3B5|nr:YciI-like protein [Deinococcus aquaedulcis]
MHFLLFYRELVPDYLTRREPLRAAHLAHARAAEARGELVLAGALADPADGAVLLFQGEGPEAAQAFAQTDPYVVSGLVGHWEVRRWMTVVGQDAAHPV